MTATSGEGPLVLPVVMSGGAGSRLWPLSTAATPKQFHRLSSRRSMLQETLARVSGQEPVRFLAPVIIGAAAHAQLIADQLAEVGAAPSAVVLEPVPRNTAAVAAVAAVVGGQLAPEAQVLLLPADHVIADPGGFRSAVARASAVGRDRIITFGIAPTGPETGYGYIQRGAALADDVFEVRRFAEKPPLDTAKAYLAEGGYDWNGGIFLFSPEVMLHELEAHRPDIASAARSALDRATRGGDGALTLDPQAFAACPSESIDVAVMEPTRLAAVAPCDVGWADLGSWSEILALGPRDADDNRLQGAAVALDARGSLIWSEGPPVAVIGLDEVIVVSTPEGVLVAPLSRAQDVKRLTQALKTLSSKPGGAL